MKTTSSCMVWTCRRGSAHTSRQRFEGEPRRRPTFIRSWSESKSMTLERPTERVDDKLGGMTHASIQPDRTWPAALFPVNSRDNRELTGGDTASSLTRNRRPNAICSTWNAPSRPSAKMIVDIASTIAKTGT